LSYTRETSSSSDELAESLGNILTPLTADRANFPALGDLPMVKTDYLV